jgi:hypothetical protein
MHHARRILSIPLCALLAMACSLAACGGGGGDGGDDDDDQQTLIVESTASLDGGVTFNNAGSVNEASPNATPLVGDQAFVMSGGTLVYNALWSFDISALPAGALIASAILQLQVTSAAGDPDASFGLARVDHANFGAVFPSTNNVTIVTFDFDQIQDLNTVGGRQIPVTIQVQADVDAGRPRSQYRVRMPFQTDNDAQADFMVFTDAENATPALRPQLIIEYTTP